MIKLLQAYNITPIFVFDGSTLPLKEETVKKRNSEKEKNRELGDQLLREGNLEGAKQMFSRAMFIKSSMTYKLIDFLEYIHIQYIVSPYEADAQIAYLCKEKIADFAISEDSDLLVYGCEDLVLKLDYEGNCENIKLGNSLNDPNVMSRIRDEFVKEIAEFPYEKFVELCIISGCDYLKNIPGIGIKRAIKFLKNSSLSEALEAISVKGPAQSKIPKGYFEEVQRIKPQFLYGRVIDPRSMKMITFNPLPKDHKMDLSGIGAEFPSEIVESYANGLYNIKKNEKRERLSQEELEKIKKELEFNRQNKLQAIATGTPYKTIPLNGTASPPKSFIKQTAPEIIQVQAQQADFIDNEVSIIHKFDIENDIKIDASSVKGIPIGEEPEKIEDKKSENSKPEAQKTDNSKIEEKKHDENSNIQAPKDRLREEMRIIMAQRRKMAEEKEKSEQKEEIKKPFEDEFKRETSTRILKKAKIIEEVLEDQKEAEIKEKYEEPDENRKKLKMILLKGIQDLDEFFGLTQAKIMNLDKLGEFQNSNL